MNVSNPLLQLLGALQQAPGSGSATAGPGSSGLVTLFGELLAAAQAEVNAANSEAGVLPPPSQAVDESPLTALFEAVEELAESLSSDGDGPMPGMNSESSVDAIPEEARAALAAIQAQVAGESVNKALRPVPKPVPVAATFSGTAGVPPTVAPRAPDGTVVSAPAPAPEQPSGLVQAQTSPAPAEAAKPAVPVAEPSGVPLPQANPVGKGETQSPPPPAPQDERGAVVVAAVREGQLAAASEGDPKGLTVRRLLSELVGQGRAEKPQDNATAVAAQRQAMLAEAIPADPALDARSSPVDLAVRPSPVTDVRSPLTGSIVSANGEPTQAPQHHARLPETVAVRDVGDFTVRSLRYLSGRTEEVITVRLIPRSLGEMQIAVRSGGDGMEVVLTASTMAARDSIELQLGGLRDAMARGGLDVTRVSVQTFTPSNGGQQPGPGHQEHSGQAPRGFVIGGGEKFVVEPERPAWWASSPWHDGGLNMLV